MTPCTTSSAHGNRENLWQLERSPAGTQSQAVQRLREVEGPLTVLHQGRTPPRIPARAQGRRDSVGLLGGIEFALLSYRSVRQEWLLHFKSAVVRVKPFTPSESANAEAQFPYWQATELGTFKTRCSSEDGAAGQGALSRLKGWAPAGAPFWRRSQDLGGGKGGCCRHFARCHSRHRAPAPAALEPRSRQMLPERHTASVQSAPGPGPQSMNSNANMRAIVGGGGFLTEIICARRAYSDVTCCEPMPAVRWPPTRSPAISGTTLWQSYKPLPRWHGDVDRSFIPSTREVPMAAETGRATPGWPSLIGLWSTARSCSLQQRRPSRRRRRWRSHEVFDRLLELCMWVRRNARQTRCFAGKVPGRIERTHGAQATCSFSRPPLRATCPRRCCPARPGPRWLAGFVRAGATSNADAMSARACRWGVWPA